MTRPKLQSKCRGFVGENLLTILTLIGVFAGGLVGFIIKNSTGEWSKREIMYISFPGEIFLRMLKCLIVPLLVSSITSAIGGLDLSMSSKIATRAICYYFVTTISAVILGICLVTTIRPGDGAQIVTSERSEKTGEEASKVMTPDTLMDLVRNMFTDNIVGATLQQYQTKLEENKTATEPLPLNMWPFKESKRDGSNVLGLVMFSIILGTTIGRMREKGQLLQDFFSTLSEAMMIITSWVIWISPLGVAFLIAAETVLTCKSIVRIEYRGERPIEPSSSWFPPKFPSG